MRRTIAQLALFALVAATLFGCGASSDPAQRTALAALATTTPQPSPSKRLPPCRPGPNLTASLRPPAPMPAPGAMPAGSFMAQIERRHHLIAGVNDGFLGFAYLNPSTGHIDGFEIDLVRQLAKAIFGNPNAYVLKALTVSQRNRFVMDGNVDIVVDAETITCKNKEQVDFSTPYYDAHQRVLVPSGSSAQGLPNLGGQRVCATTNSAPIPVIQQYPTHPIAVGASQAIDCLVYLQEGAGRIAAISTDDSILEGFKAQDPNTRIVGTSLAPVPYGMAISKAHPGFVRFVNGVLAQVRTDGTWASLYRKWLRKFSPTSPPPSPPQPTYTR
jgi:polar amino acid transport system substrate-binding protein